MTNSKSKIIYHYTLTFSAFVFCLTSCLTPPDNNKTDKNFENEFIESIKQDNAKIFDFQHDVLTPQKSYFVDNKLKYLTFRHGPEVGFVECRLTFDLTTDSIEKYTLRQVLPNFQQSGDERKVFDTIFVFYPKRHISETYYANKLMDTTFRKDMFDEQIPFINDVKSSTQKEFNSRQQKYCCKWGWTLKHQLCATISSSSGLTNKAKLKFLTSSTKQSQAAVPG